MDVYAGRALLGARRGGGVTLWRGMCRGVPFKHGLLVVATVRTATCTLPTCIPPSRSSSQQAIPSSLACLPQRLCICILHVTLSHICFQPPPPQKKKKHTKATDG
jgi:hypothetical protein